MIPLTPLATRHLGTDCFFTLKYAFASQAKLHGFYPGATIREVAPRLGWDQIFEDDILEVLDKEGSSIALVLFSGVQFRTGQVFPMERVTERAHEQVMTLLNSTLVMLFS